MANSPDSLGQLPIHVALRKNCNIDVINALLRENPTSVWAADARGCVPLSLALRIGAPFDTVKLLVERTADRPRPAGTAGEDFARAILRFAVSYRGADAGGLLRLILHLLPSVHPVNVPELLSEAFSSGAGAEVVAVLMEQLPEDVDDDTYKVALHGALQCGSSADVIKAVLGRRPHIRFRPVNGVHPIDVVRKRSRVPDPAVILALVHEDLTSHPEDLTSQLSKLTAAMWTSSEELAELTLRHQPGASKVNDSELGSALPYALLNRCPLAVVDKLLEAPDCVAAVRDKADPCTIAILSGCHVDVVVRVADKFAENSVWGPKTLLFDALGRGPKADAAVVRELLLREATAGWTKGVFTTWLHMAVMRRCPVEVVRVLLTGGATVHAEGKADGPPETKADGPPVASTWSEDLRTMDGAEMKDHGHTPLTLWLSTYTPDADIDVGYELLRATASDSNLSNYWADFVRSSATVHEIVRRVIRDPPRNLSDLLTARDSNFCRVIDGAPLSLKREMRKLLFRLELYEVLEDEPTHGSATSLVLRAREHSERDLSEERAAAEPSETLVALKYFTRPDMWEAERRARDVMIGRLDCAGGAGAAPATETGLCSACATPDNLTDCGVFVPMIKASGDPYQHKGMGPVYSHVLIMPWCSATLKETVRKGFNNSAQWPAEVRRVTTEIAECLKRLHAAGLVHGDVKPDNIAYYQRDSAAHVWRLLDFDASVESGQPLTGKSSSGYMPPECWTGGEYRPDLVAAGPAVDCWALGVTLYHMLTGAALFHCNDVTGDVMEPVAVGNTLGAWESSPQREAALAAVSDPLARNLLSLLLVTSPDHRHTAELVLVHPYVTGGAVRAPRDPPAVEVFISYRQRASRVEADELYWLLKAEHGLQAWMDTEDLGPGDEWRRVFLQNLVSSAVVAVLISEGTHPRLVGGVADPFTADSPLDNVLLEYRFIAELLERRHYLTCVMPILLPSPAGTELRMSGFSPPDITITEVEQCARQWLTNLGFGTSILTDTSVKNVWDYAVGRHQAHKGSLRDAAINLCHRVRGSCTCTAAAVSPVAAPPPPPPSGSPTV